MNFGGQGFTFGQPAAATTTAATAATTAAATAAPAGGFSFGGGSGGFSFGTPATAAAPAAAPAAAAAAPSGGGFSFSGAKPPTSTTSAAFSFGVATPAVAAAPVAAPVASTPAASVSSLGSAAGFGAAPVASGILGAAVAPSTTSSSQSFSFGGLTTQSVAKPVMTTVAPSTGFSFGTSTASGTKMPSATPAAAAVVPVAATPSAPLAAAVAPVAATPAAPAAAVSSGSSAGSATFGFAVAAPSAASLGSLTAAAATASATTAVPSVVGFGVTPSVALSAATSGAAAGLLSTATTKAPATALSTATTLSTAKTAAVPTAAPAAMTYRQLEETINKWNIELEEQEKIFLQQATHVNAWDRILCDNGEKITQLNADVDRVKMDQGRLDLELDFILSQQRELQELLAPLEHSVEMLPPISYQQHADYEREHTYKLARNVDGQLKRMVQDLREIVEHLNVNSGNKDSADPIYQISKILNAHLDSLQWVEQNTVVLQRRVDEISKLVDLQRKEQERNFRLAYD